MLRHSLGIAEIFDNADLEAQAYHQYSAQFLPPYETLANQPPEQRAKILCESGKDPFSPPLNSLQAFQATVDPERVKACFKRGHYLYRQIIEKRLDELEPARLYKLGWTIEETKPFFKTFRKIWPVVKKLKTEDDLDQYTQELAASDQTINQIISNALFANKGSILEALGRTPPFAKENALKIVYETVRDNIKEKIAFDFFKSKKTYEELQSGHSVYDPSNDQNGKVTHSWGTNLAWTLAHLRRGNRFIVCSDLLSNQYRAHYEDTPSAFAREICVALKAGYTLQKTEDGITLKPLGLNDERLKSLDSTGALGDGVNPTYGEIAQIYKLLQNARLDEQKNFQCSFEFQNGSVKMRDLSQLESQPVNQPIPLEAAPTRNDSTTTNFSAILEDLSESFRELGQTGTSDSSPTPINANTPRDPLIFSPGETPPTFADAPNLAVPPSSSEDPSKIATQENKGSPMTTNSPKKP